MNIHIIHGRLARNPELAKNQDENKNRVTFTVAVDRRFGDETDFIDCVCFGKRAKVIDKYFSTGSEIIVSGEGQIHSYEDKNGIKRKSYSIVVSDFDFCGSKKDNGQAEKVESAAKSLLMPDTMEKQAEDIPF